MVIRFKLDENIPNDAEDLLRQAGHDVHSVLAEQLGGNPDSRVFDGSQAEARVLVTFSLDFSNISVFTLHLVITASGYCVRMRKVSRTRSAC
jgi:predicted nuclease of predicted toxin-antitoxin system